MTKPVDAPEWMSEQDFALDLGDGHWASFMGHGGDGVTGPEGQPLPRVERIGLLIHHRCDKTESGFEAGYIRFDVPENADVARPRWKVESWEPLTLSPSILVRSCGDHGFIRDGKWVRA